MIVILPAKYRSRNFEHELLPLLVGHKVFGIQNHNYLFHFALFFVTGVDIIVYNPLFLSMLEKCLWDI